MIISFSDHPHSFGRFVVLFLFFYVLCLKVVSKIKQNHYDTVRFTKTHAQFSQLIRLQKILFFQKGYDFEACTS